MPLPSPSFKPTQAGPTPSFAPAPPPNVASEFLKGLGRGFERIPGIVIGAGGEMVGELTNVKLLEEKGRAIRKFFERETMRGIEAPHPYVYTGKFKEHPYIKSASLIGEAIPWLVTAIATRGASIKAGLSPLAASWVAAGGIGMGAGMPSTFVEAREAGASKARAAVSGAASGIGETVLEFFPLNYIFRGGSGRVWKQVLKGMMGEGAEEYIQEMWSNIVAKVGYDKTRELYNNTLEAFIGGAGAGAVGGAITTGTKPVQAEKKIKAFKKEMTDKGFTPKEADLAVSQMTSHHEENIKDIIMAALNRGRNFPITAESDTYQIPDGFKDTPVGKTLGTIKGARQNQAAFNKIANEEFNLPETMTLAGGKNSVKISELPLELQAEIKKQLESEAKLERLDKDGTIKKDKKKDVFNNLQLLINKGFTNSLYWRGGWAEDPNTELTINGHNVLSKDAHRFLMHMGLLTIDKNTKPVISDDLKIITSSDTNDAKTIKDNILSSAQRNMVELQQIALKKAVQPTPPITPNLNVLAETFAKGAKPVKPQVAKFKKVDIKREVILPDRGIERNKYDMNVKANARRLMYKLMPWIGVKEGKVAGKDFHVAKTDRANKSITVDSKQISALFERYRARKELFVDARGEPLGLVPLPPGLSESEFRAFIINHEKVHAATGLDAGRADENMANILALEFMGKNRMASTMEANLSKTAVEKPAIVDTVQYDFSETPTKKETSIREVGVEQTADRQSILDIMNIYLESNGLPTQADLTTALDYTVKLSGNHKDGLRRFLADHNFDENQIQRAFLPDTQAYIEKHGFSEYFKGYHIALSPEAQALKNALKQRDIDMALTSPESYVEWRMNEFRKTHTLKDGRLDKAFKNYEGSFRLKAKNEWANLARDGRTLDPVWVEKLFNMRMEQITQSAGRTLEDIQTEITNNEQASYDDVRPKEMPTEDDSVRDDQATDLGRIKAENENLSDIERDEDDYFPATILPQGTSLETAEMGAALKLSLRALRFIGFEQIDFEQFMGERWVRKRKEHVRMVTENRKHASTDVAGITGAMHLRTTDELFDFLRDDAISTITKENIRIAKDYGITFKNKLEEQKYNKIIKFVEMLAGEEVMTSKDPKKFSTTNIGSQRMFRTADEAKVFNATYKEALEALKPYHKWIPDPKAYTEHPKLAFFNLLLPGHQGIITTMKSQTENPLLQEAVKKGLLDDSYIIQRNQDGFQHRVWDYTDQQKRKGMSVSNLLRDNQFVGDHWLTGYEFYQHALEKKLVPKMDYALSVGDYIYDVLQKIEKQNFFPTIKILPHPDYPDELSAVVYEGVDDLLEVKAGDKQWHAKAVELGYREFKPATGLVKWSKGRFLPAFVYSPLADKLESILITAQDKPLNWLLRGSSRINSFIKRYMIMFAPNMYLMQILSSPWLWVGPGAAWRTGGIKSILTGEYVWKGIPEGIKVLKGEIDATEYLKKAWYDPKKMRIFLQHGIIRNPSKRIKQFFDPYEAAEADPGMKSKAENMKAWLTGKLGIDQYTFGKIITMAAYTYADSMVNRVMKDQGISDYEKAAQFIAPMITDSMGMPSPAIYGRAGDLLQALWFARDFTNTALRQLTGALGIHTNYSHEGGKQFVQHLFHAEISKEQLKKLQPYYFRQLAQVTVAKVLLVSMLQFMLMRHDDDEEPSFPWQNEPGRKIYIKTPFKEGTSRRYIDSLVFREFGDLLQWMTAPGSRAKAKLAWVPRMLLEQFSNRDWSGRRITADSANIPFWERMRDRLRHIGISTLPSPLRPGMRVPGGKLGQMLMTGVGLPQRKGMPIQTGYDIQTAYEMRRAADVQTYEREKISRIMSGLKPGDKKALELRRQGKITARQYRDWVRRYYYPQMMLRRRIGRRGMAEYFRR